MNRGRDRFIIAALRSERLAIPLGHVSEVMENFRTFPIPRAPVFFPGVINSHGSPTPVLDLASFLYGDPPAPDGTLLILDHRTATLALRIDRVERIISADGPAEDDNTDNGLTNRTVFYNESSIRTLNLELLVEMLEQELSRRPASSTRSGAPA